MKRCVTCGHQFRSLDWRCPSCGFSPHVCDGFRTFAPDLARDESGYDAANFARLAEREAGHFWFRSRNRLIVWALQRFFPRARSFLEVGCGTGFVLSGIVPAFPAIRLVGSEIHVAGLGLAARRVGPSVELLQIDARHVPFIDEFDVVGAFDVIEHIEEDETALAEFHGATRPGGGLLLTVPQHRFLWSATDEAAHHKRRYTAEELRRKVEKAGYTAIRMTSFVSLLLPLMVLARWRGRAGQDYDLERELRIGRPANAIMEWIMGIELACIRSGLDLPAGGSLLLVGRKP